MLGAERARWGGGQLFPPKGPGVCVFCRALGQAGVRAWEAGASLLTNTAIPGNVARFILLCKKVQSVLSLGARTCVFVWGAHTVFLRVHGVPMTGLVAGQVGQLLRVQGLSGHVSSSCKHRGPHFSLCLNQSRLLFPEGPSRFEGWADTPRGQQNWARA